MGHETITVTGMSCGGCEDNVETALHGLDGVSEATADNEADTVEVVFDSVSVDDLHDAIEDAGYEVQA